MPILVTMMKTVLVSMLQCFPMKIKFLKVSDKNVLSCSIAIKDLNFPAGTFTIESGGKCGGGRCRM